MIFDTFWAAYPVKRDKKKCRRIWSRRKMDSMIEMLLKDIELRILHDDRWKDGYIPYPSTYLNGDRWEDDLKMPDLIIQKKRNDESERQLQERIAASIKRGDEEMKEYIALVKERRQ